MLTLALEREEVMVSLFELLGVGNSTQVEASTANKRAAGVVIRDLTQFLSPHETIAAHQLPILH